MANFTTYDATVAARTRAADLVLADSTLLAAYQDIGGLPADLQKISTHGHTAELLDQAQSTAQAAGGAATMTVLTAFAALQKGYVALMDVLTIVLHDLVESKASPALVSEVEKIMVNEAEVFFKVRTDDKGAQKRVAVKRTTQEAVRAEIGKDARALLALAAVHPMLAERKWDKARLDKLAADADAMAGKLAERAYHKGSSKEATAAMRDAVAAQKKVWGGCYRLLAALARTSPQVAQLLSEAARPRPPKQAKPNE